MKIGDLVKYKGTLGIVTAKVTKSWAQPGDVWVLWTDERQPACENAEFLELINARR